MNHPPDEELESLLAAYSETQDQLLAVFALTQATQNVSELPQLLDLLTNQARNLLGASGLFFLVEAEGHYHFSSYPSRSLFIHEILSQMAHIPASGRAHSIALTPPKNQGGNPAYYAYVRELENSGRVCMGFSSPIPPEEINPVLRLGQLIADQAKIQVANLYFHQSIVAKTRMETEMRVAQDVQTQLLPKELPDLSSMHLQTAVYFHPASLIGGDFYDFTRTSENTFAFAIGDISGKGIPAALLMVMVLTALRAKTNSEHHYTPGEILTRINQELYPEFIRTGGFATAFYGRFDAETCTLDTVNAGHSPVVYCPAEGGARLLGPDGPPVGVLPSRNYQCKRLRLQPGDVVVAGTDGFSEAQNPAQAMFGNDHFLQLVEQMRTYPAEIIKNQLVAETRAFAAGYPQSDDQTLVVLKCGCPRTTSLMDQPHALP